MPQVDGINIPEDWCDLLTDLQKQDPKAVLAGGAIRDLFLGHFPKDLDFFTEGVFPTWENPRESGMDYEGMKYVVAVGEFDLRLPTNVIIIEPCSTMELIESFDFGICQVAFDGKQIIKSPAFDWDYKYGLMTMRHIDRYQRSIRRWCRINQRIGLEIAIPELETKKVMVDAQPS